eukprot:571567-Rhodomonas_salina.2
MVLLVRSYVIGLDLNGPAINSLRLPRFARLQLAIYSQSVRGSASESADTRSSTKPGPWGSGHSAGPGPSHCLS